MPMRVSPRLATNFKSTFLSCEKDQETILKKLFVNSKPYSDKLKRLLVLNNPDCLDDTNVEYFRVIDSYSLSKLKHEGYIRVTPRLDLDEHETMKSYIILSFDDFVPSAANPEYRDSIISFTVICNTDIWELDDYRLRPYQIAALIDGLMNGSKLSGIGTLNFIGASMINYDERLSGIVIMYSATHEADYKGDEIPADTSGRC